MGKTGFAIIGRNVRGTKINYGLVSMKTTGQNKRIDLVLLNRLGNDGSNEKNKKIYKKILDIINKEYVLKDLSKKSRGKTIFSKKSLILPGTINKYI